MLYFAYGSNMSSGQMETVDRDAEFIGIARLRDHKLQFDLPSNKWRGCVADIVPDDECEVWGVVYEVSDEGVHALDRKEAVDLGRYERTLVSLLIDGKSFECLTYRVKTPQRPCRPSVEYLYVIVSGAREKRLPAEYIRALEMTEVVVDQVS